MINKLFNLFFEKDKKSCLTVIKDREYTLEEKRTEKKPQEFAVKKELKSYFANCVGLNVKERKAFSKAVMSAQRQR